ncbi:hypothetical protein PCASD_25175, partial [Puccinia coronata f. sp. avenae]
ETERLVSDAPPGISAVRTMITYDTSMWLFKLELFLPEDYPMSPPKVRFLTKDLSSQHRQTRTNMSRHIKRTVLLSIQALLSSPNPDDPLANDVAQHYKSDEAGAIQLSREWTTKYAQPN